MTVLLVLFAVFAVVSVGYFMVKTRQLREAAEDIDYIETCFALHATFGKRRTA